MPDGIDQLRGRREESRAKRSAPTPRHPRNDRVTASEKDSAAAAATLGEAPVSASGNTHAEQAATAVLSASENPAPTKTVSASGNPVLTRSRRGVPIGRPRGPERVALSVRITRELDDLLIIEIRETGDAPQTIVERALVDYLAKQQRKRERQRKGTPTGSP